MDGIDSGTVPDNDETRGLVAEMLSKTQGLDVNIHPTGQVGPGEKTLGEHLGNLRDLGTGALQGLGSLAGGVLDAADRLRALGDETEFGGPEPAAIGQFTQDISEALPKPENPTSLLGAVGSMGGQVAGAGLAAAAAGPVGVAGLFGASSTGHALNEAAISNATPAQKAAFVVGQGLLGTFMGSVGPAGQATRTAAAAFLKRAGAQGGTMLAYQIGDFATRKLTIEPDAQLDPEQMVKEALAAVLVGEVAHGLGKVAEKVGGAKPAAAPETPSAKSGEQLMFERLQKADEDAAAALERTKPVAEKEVTAEKPVEKPPVEDVPAQENPLFNPDEQAPAKKPLEEMSADELHADVKRALGEEEKPPAPPEAKTEATSTEQGKADSTPEIAPEPTPTIGLKAKAAKAAAIAYGEFEPKRGEKIIPREKFEEAAEKLEADPGAGKRLLKDLSENPRPPEVDEYALLSNEIVRLTNERTEAGKAYKTNPTADNLERVKAAREEYQSARDTIGISKTKSGQSLNALRYMQREDYSVANLEYERLEARKGKPLEAKHLAEIEKIHEDYERTLKAKDAEYQRMTGERLAKMEADLASIKRPLATKKQGKVLDFFDKQGDEAMAFLKKRLKHANTSVFVDPEVHAAVVKVAAKYIAHGVDAGAKLIEHFGEEIRPHLDDIILRARAMHEPALAARLRREDDLEKQIKKLEERIAKGDIAPQTKQGPEPESTAKLIERRDALNDQIAEMRKKPLKQKQYKTEAARLKEQVDELNRQIETGEKPIKGERQTVDTEEVAALKAEREKLRDELAESRKPTPKTDTEKATARIEKDTLRLRAKNMFKDFSARQRLTKVLHKDPAYEKAAAEHEAVKAERERLKQEDYLANRTPSERAKDALLEGPRTLLGIRTIADFSAFMNQGGAFVSAHPIKALRLVPEIAKATVSEEAFQRLDARIKARDKADMDRADGLELTEIDAKPTKQEEGFRSRIMNKIPIARASNRAFVSTLNLMSITLKDILDRATPNDAGRKLNANAVNILRGRGAVGKGKFADAVRILGSVNWAPRLMVSRFEAAVGGPIWYAAWKRDPAAVKRLAIEYARIMAGMGAANYMLGLAGDEQEYDPKSTHFLETRFGKTWVDPTFGLANAITFMSRMVSGERENAKGEDVPIRGKLKFGQPNSLDIAVQFERGKLGPTAGVVTDAFVGTDFKGDPINYNAEWFARHTLPLAPLDIYDALKEEGYSRGTALGLMALFGMQVNTYENKARR